MASGPEARKGFDWESFAAGFRHLSTTHLEELTKLVERFLRLAVQAGGDKANQELGITGSFQLEDPEAIKYLSQAAEFWANEKYTAIREQVREALMAGIGEGESIPELKKRISGVYTGLANAEVIARTETVRAANYGREIGYMQSGLVDEKQWVVTHDDRLCQECRRMANQNVQLGSSFFSTLYGYVKNPPLHPNCRCTIIPVLRKDAVQTKQGYTKSEAMQRVEKECGTPIPQLLDEMYTQQGMSTRQIGHVFQVSHPTVLKWLHLFGIETRPPGIEKAEDKTQYDKEGRPGHWVTIRGRAVFIREGETASEAFRRQEKEKPEKKEAPPEKKPAKKKPKRKAKPPKPTKPTPLSEQTRFEALVVGDTTNLPLELYAQNSPITLKPGGEETLTARDSVGREYMAGTGRENDPMYFKKQIADEVTIYRDQELVTDRWQFMPKDIVKLLRQLPDVLRAPINEIFLFNRRCGDYNPKKRCGGYWDPMKDGRIAIFAMRYYRAYPRPYFAHHMEELVLHEFGHAVGARYLFQKGLRPELTDLFLKWRRIVRNSGEAPLTDYAKTDSNEDFCEHFAMAFDSKSVVRDRLKQLAPRRHKFIMEELPKTVERHLRLERLRGDLSKKIASTIKVRLDDGTMNNFAARRLNPNYSEFEPKSSAKVIKLIRQHLKLPKKMFNIEAEPVVFEYGGNKVIFNISPKSLPTRGKPTEAAPKRVQRARCAHMVDSRFAAPKGENCRNHMMECRGYDADSAARICGWIASRAGPAQTEDSWLEHTLDRLLYRKRKLPTWQLHIPVNDAIRGPTNWSHVHYYRSVR